MNADDVNNAEQLGLATTILTVEVMAAKLRATARGIRASAPYADKESQAQKERKEAAELEMQAESLELLISIAKGVKEELHDAFNNVAEATVKTCVAAQFIDIGNVIVLDAAEATAAVRVATKANAAGVILHVGGLKVVIPTQPLPCPKCGDLPPKPAVSAPVLPNRNPASPRQDSSRP